MWVTGRPLGLSGPHLGLRRYSVRASLEPRRAGKGRPRPLALGATFLDLPVMANRGGKGELLGAPADRLGADVVSALKRKPASEARLAGVVRALAPFSATLRNAVTDSLETLVTRGSYTRPLYAAGVRALAE